MEHILLEMCTLFKFRINILLIDGLDSKPKDKYQHLYIFFSIFLLEILSNFTQKFLDLIFFLLIYEMLIIIIKTFFFDIISLNF